MNKRSISEADFVKVGGSGLDLQGQPLSNQSAFNRRSPLRAHMLAMHEVLTREAKIR